MSNNSTLDMLKKMGASEGKNSVQPIDFKEEVSRDTPQIKKELKMEAILAQSLSNSYGKDNTPMD